MAEHRQGQHLRRNNVSQASTNTITRDHSERRLRLDVCNEHAFEDTESESEEQDYVEPDDREAFRQDPVKSYGPEAFKRRDHQTSCTRSTLSERLHSAASQPSLETDVKLIRKIMLETEPTLGMREAMLKERQINQRSRKDGFALGWGREATAGKIGSLLEGTLDRHVW